MGVTWSGAPDRKQAGAARGRSGTSFSVRPDRAEPAGAGASRARTSPTGFSSTRTPGSRCPSSSRPFWSRSSSRWRPCPRSAAGLHGSGSTPSTAPSAASTRHWSS